MFEGGGSEEGKAFSRIQLSCFNNNWYQLPHLCQIATPAFLKIHEPHESPRHYAYTYSQSLLPDTDPNTRTALRVLRKGFEQLHGLHDSS